MFYASLVESEDRFEFLFLTFYKKRIEQFYIFTLFTFLFIA